MLTDATLKPFVDKLSLRSSLSRDEQDSILTVQYRQAVRKAGEALGAVETKRERFCIVQTGFAQLQRLDHSGARQIQAIYLPGDLIDLNIARGEGPCRIEALVPSLVGYLDRAAFAGLAAASPNIRAAIWAEIFAQNAICREWLYNLGRRSAFERLCHFICELSQREKDAGLSDGMSCLLPLTQIDIGDATGLTPVHVNRTFRRMRDGGLISYDRRMLVIEDLVGLRGACGFDDSYLYPEPA